MKYLISNIIKFLQVLKEEGMKNQGGLLIQYYNSNVLVQKSLLVKEVYIFYCLMNRMKKVNAWCLVRYLNSSNKSPATFRNVDNEFGRCKC